MTMTGWMIYAVVVSLLLGGGAWLLDRALAGVGVPSRWIWLGTLILSAVLPVSGLLAPQAELPVGEQSPVFPALDTPHVALGVPGRPAAAASRRGNLARFREATELWLVEPLNSVIAWGSALVAEGPLTARAPSDRASGMGLVWLLASTSLVAVILWGRFRLLRRSRRWPLSKRLGRTVRISPDLGPAAVGVFRPEIVVPRWTLDLSTEELRLILEHEEEHVRARDPLLLAAALAPAIAVPWNPVLWWQLRRLRDAVEVDCDRRVLRRHPVAVRYGRLLLKLGSGSHSEILPSPAIAGSPSLLERRLRAMKRRSLTRALPSAAAAGLVALVLVAVACGAEAPAVPRADQEAELPTLATNQGALTPINADSIDAERRARGLLGVGREPATLEGGPVELARLDDGAWAAQGLYLNRGDDVLRIDARRTPIRVVDVGATSGDNTDSAEDPRPGQDPRPLIYIDGVRLGDVTTLGELLSPDEIESIEVIRGPAAAALYGDAAAAGVIQITTREGGPNGPDAPEPAPSPPSPAPEPQPEPTPAPEPQPTPEPAPLPSPAPTPELAPAPQVPPPVTPRGTATLERLLREDPPPRIFVDGAEVATEDFFLPADIESIEIIRGPTGPVIRITTNEDAAPIGAAPPPSQQDTLPALARGPQFTPYEVAPLITNREEVQVALLREYPPALRDAGIGGRALVYVFITDGGDVLNAVLAETSGQVQLDSAALRVAGQFEFEPAQLDEVPIPVSIQLPIAFSSR